MAEDSEDKKLNAVEKALGEPVAPELNENAWKVRKNLVIISAVAMAAVLADLRIDDGSSLLGLKLSGLSDAVLRTGLLCVLSYLSIHFLWAAFDSFLEWRLRITGTRLSFITTARFASEEGDYPNDPRQSTLYSWWLDHAKRIGNLSARFLDLERLLQNLDQDLRARYTNGADAMNIVNACKPINEARETMVKLQQSVDEVQKTIFASRVPVSLKRFDRWFELFLRSQNLRWLVIDILVPVLLASSAMWLLLQH